MKKLWKKITDRVTAHPWKTATIGLVSLTALITLITGNWLITVLLVASAATYIVADRLKG